MRLRVIVDEIFVVANRYRKGEEFDALTFENIPQECVEVVSGAPVAVAPAAAPARRAAPAAPRARTLAEMLE